MADSSGAALALNSYDAYGIPAATNLGRFAYTGQIMLPELGLYYYKARIYSPTLGRFLQTDPIGYKDDIDLYAYVKGDPVNGRDPSGTSVTGGCDGGLRDICLQTSSPSSETQPIVVTGHRNSSPPTRGMGDNGGPPLKDISNILSLMKSFLNRTPLGVFLTTLFTPGQTYDSPVNNNSEAFHYTFSSNLSSIITNGLRPGSYATDTGSLTSLQAQLDLALSPNQGLRDALVRIDLSGLRGAGYDVPSFTQAGRMFNMPGGGQEMQFPYAVPPEFLSGVK